MKSIQFLRIHIDPDTFVASSVVDEVGYQIKSFSDYEKVEILDLTHAIQVIDKATTLKVFLFISMLKLIYLRLIFPASYFSGYLLKITVNCLKVSLL